MSKMLSGAKLKMTIGAYTVAYATNATFTINHNHQPIEVFGKPEVYEYTELGTTVEFSASHFRINNNGAQQAGVMPTLESFLKQPTLQVTITNTSDNGASIITISDVKCTSRSTSVDARGVMTETLNFLGLKIVDAVPA